MQGFWFTKYMKWSFSNSAHPEKDQTCSVMLAAVPQMEDGNPRWGPLFTSHTQPLSSNICRSDLMLIEGWLLLYWEVSDQLLIPTGTSEHSWHVADHCMRPIKRSSSKQDKKFSTWNGSADYANEYVNLDVPWDDAGRPTYRTNCVLLTESSNPLCQIQVCWYRLAPCFRHRAPWMHKIINRSTERARTQLSVQLRLKARVCDNKILGYVPQQLNFQLYHKHSSYITPVSTRSTRRTCWNLCYRW